MRGVVGVSLSGMSPMSLGKMGAMIGVSPPLVSASRFANVPGAFDIAGLGNTVTMSQGRRAFFVNGPGSSITSEASIVFRTLSEAHPFLSEFKPRLENALDGIWLPKDRNTRERFLEGIREYIEHNRIKLVLERLKHTAEGRRSYVWLENDVKLFKTYLIELKDLTLIAMRSKNPSTYMRFMARPDFDSYSFIRSMHVFSGEREISFKDVQKEKAAIGKEILELVRDGSEEALSCLCRKVVEICNKFIQKEENKEWDLFWSAVNILSAILNNVAVALDLIKNLNERFSDYFYTFDEEFVGEIDEYHLDETEEAILAEHGLLAYYLDDHFELVSFSRTFALGTLIGYVENETEILEMERASGMAYRKNRMLLKSEDKETVQHELQHLFDNILGICSSRSDGEYRAKLAGIAFSDKPQEAAIRIASNTPANRLFRAVMQFESIDEDDDTIGGSGFPDHTHADERINLEMPDAWWKDEDKARAEAIHLLNEEYRKICGLSYDEILEPFRE